ncbi:DMT family transporter [Halostella sp. JP-L12]|uniref:DMT family transporter n=1 Tax=Halostella TaxID=1843185 RepID=UPI000EF7AF0D|nr:MULTISPECIES: DMT family transporter [Halostella]NHN49559.1 DMT family transporter [Halostella sp. JP-L12]
MSDARDGPVSPMAALAVAVLAVSTSAILVRWSEAPSVVKAFYRVVFTAGLVAPVAAARHGDDFRRLSPRDGGWAVLAGLALAIHFAAWFESLNHTSVAASVTLVQTQPLFVAAGAFLLLSERVTRRTVAGIGVALVGAAAMSLGDAGGAATTGRALLGNALALLGAVTAAGYVLAGRSIRQRVSLFPYVTVVYVACAAALLVVVLARGYPLLDYPPREWLLFLGMAVGPGVFGHTVINWALEHVESSVVSVSLLGEPVGSTLLAMVLLAEVPSTATVVAGAIVLGGIYVTTTAREDGAA